MTSASVSVEGFDSSPIFEDIQNVLKDDKIAAQIVDEFKAVYQFNIANPGNSKNQVWTLDLKNKDSAGVFLGEKSETPDCTLTMNDDICRDIMTGKMNPQNAFFAQKLKMKGSLPLGIKLQNLRKYQKNTPSKL